ncbi:MAG: hypothetical protein ACOCYP_10730 [Planctomycetota bacterium]
MVNPAGVASADATSPHRAMSVIALLLLLLLTAAAATGAEPVVLTTHELARPGLPLRIALHGIPSELDPQAPAGLEYALLHGETVLAEDAHALERADQLAAGAVVHLVPPLDLPAAELQCRVILRDAEHQAAVVLEQPVESLPRLFARAGTAAADLRADDTRAALPRLWAEITARLTTRPPTLAACRRIAAMNAAIRAWLAGERPADDAPGMHALRCPIDDSVQPYRLHLPPTPDADAPAVLLFPDAQHGVAKHRWPIERELVDALTAQGLPVIEFYPAGDRDWSGVALLRTRLLADRLLARSGLTGRALCVVGSGTGAAAALDHARRRPLDLNACLLVAAQMEAPAAPGWLADLPPEHHRWLLARRRVSGHWPQLAALPIALVAPADAATRALRAQHDQGGGWSRFAHDELDSAARWLRRSSATFQPPATIAWRIAAPGDHGPIRVHALEGWAEPGSLVLHRDTPGAPTVHLDGLGPVSWTGSDPAPRIADGTLITQPEPASLPRKRLGAATGPAGAYATGAFTVVVGSGDHAAAARRNAALAQAFAADWVAHAHGAPQVVADRDFDPAGHSTANLVCVGNPRSNTLLARLVPQTGFAHIRWDDLALELGERRIRRTADYALALAMPHPEDPRRLVVIIDGQPAWQRDGRLPLGSVPDLLLRVQGEPATAVLLDNDWSWLPDALHTPGAR